MSRDSYADVCTLNIRVHTKHAPEEYVELWRKLFGLRQYIVHIHTGVMIGEASAVNLDDPASPIRGYFYKFLDIDKSEPWFDMVQKKKANDADMSKIVIPDELRPNLTEIPYVFDPIKHRLHFITRASKTALSPSMAHRLISSLSLAEAIQDRFNDVDVSIVTDTAEIERMLGLRVLKSLTITLQRPNPTDKEDDILFYERMNRLGIGKEEHAYKKASGALTIKPDEEIRKLAFIAAENGEVKVTGRDEANKPIVASSTSFPKKVRLKYAKTVQTLLSVLVDFVVK